MISNDGLFYGYISLYLFFFTIIFLILYKFHSNKHNNPVKLIVNNNKFSKFYYQITVNGGLQSTLSNDISVYVKIIGNKNDSVVHCLKEAARYTEETENSIFSKVKRFFKKRRVFFKRGETKSFLINEPNSLGDIEAIKFWFSLGAQQTARSFAEELADLKLRRWYLNYVTVFDLSEEKTYNFLCYTWILVDLEHKISSFVCMATKLVGMKNFGHNFLAHLVNMLFLENIFISLLISPRSPYMFVPKYFKLFLILILSSINLYYSFKKPNQIDIYSLLVGFMANFIIFLVYEMLFKKYYFLKWHLGQKEKCKKNTFFEDHLKENYSNDGTNNNGNKIDICKSIIKEIKDEFEVFNKYQIFFSLNMYKSPGKFVRRNSFLVCIQIFFQLK